MDRKETKMESRIDIYDIINTINRSRHTKISSTPAKREDKKWALFQGENHLPGFTYAFQILYIFSDATLESIANAHHAVQDKKSTHVIYAPSTNRFQESLESTFSSYQQVKSSNDYLHGYVKDQINPYLDILRENSPKFYIDPRVEVPAGFPRRIPNPLFSFLNKILPIDSESDGLAVMLAAPGQGKTYCSRHLASELCKGKTIPIYIHSQQWAKMHPDDLSSLWKTIANCFNYFDSPLSILNGDEENALKTLLKCGLFSVIFDGFDEYILWNNGRINPVDALNSLVELSTSSNSKVLITSRTTFWEANIEQDSIESNKISIYKLMSFNHDHAKVYFDKRFENNNALTSKALGIFQHLHKSSNDSENDNPIGRGFILNLIADIIQRDSNGQSIVDHNKPSHFFMWIIHSLCEREALRQKLKLTADKQIQFLKSLAEESLTANITDDYLREILEIHNEGELTENDLDILVGSPSGRTPAKLCDHPIITKTGNHWVFLEEQVKQFLLADTLIDNFNTNESPAQIWLSGFISKLSDNVDIADISSAVIDIIHYNQNNSKFTDAAIKSIIQNIQDVGTSILKSNDNALLLASSIATTALNKFSPSTNTSKTDRTTKLLAYFGRDTFDKAVLSGTLSGLDLTNTTFSECKFLNITWTNCIFDERTNFKNCTFISGFSINCKGFGKSTWDNCIFNTESKQFIDAERIKEGKKNYSLQNLSADIHAIIKKFIPKDGAGFKRVSEPNLSKGIISNSKHKDIIIDAFTQHLLDRHIVSGYSDSVFHIKDDAKDCIIHYSGNGVYTGKLLLMFEHLKKKTGLLK